MNLKNKIVLITGASSGIGEACAHQFARAGAHLILTARRVDKLEKLSKQLNDNYQVRILTLAMDVQNRAQVEKTIQNLSQAWQRIDILINNAGLALSSDKIQDAKVENWETMLKTNVNGLLYVTHAVLPTMLTHNSGHIVNIGSVAGQECYSGGNVYAASKHAVRAISKSMRIDLLGTAIKVTEIAPGAVHTEFSEVRWQDKARAEQFYSDFQPLLADDIADAITYCTSRPAHVNIAEMLIFPVDQASANHIFKGGKEKKNLLSNN